jgi:hypothetical protein
MMFRETIAVLYEAHMKHKSEIGGWGGAVQNFCT